MIYESWFRQSIAIEIQIFWQIMRANQLYTGRILAFHWLEQANEIRATSLRPALGRSMADFD